MILRIAAFCFIFSGLTGRLSAQEDSLKTTNHYLSIQSNQLLRQVLSFGGNIPAVSNPYLLNYAFNSRSTGWGMNFGLGYVVRTFDDGDELNKRESTINEFFFRAGVEQKVYLTERWLMAWGADISRRDVSNTTININKFDDGEQEVKIETENSNKGWGFGPRVSLSFLINKRMIIGTEANYYYLVTTNTGLVKTTSRFLEFDQNTGGQGIVEREEEVESEGKNKNFSLELPTVIYLTFTF